MDVEEEKKIEDVDIKEEVFMHITKEEIMIVMMEVINLQFLKFSVFILRYLVIMSEIVGKNNRNELIFLKK